MCHPSATSLTRNNDARTRRPLGICTDRLEIEFKALMRSSGTTSKCDQMRRVTTITQIYGKFFNASCTCTPMRRVSCGAFCDNVIRASHASACKRAVLEKFHRSGGTVNIKWHRYFFFLPCKKRSEKLRFHLFFYFYSRTIRRFIFIPCVV